MPDPSGGLKLARGFAAILLLVIIAWQGAGLIWKIVGSSRNDGEIRSAALPERTGRATALRGISGETGSSAAELPLFGVSTSARISKPGPSHDVPLTSLALILKGVVMADPVSRAMAVIAEKNKPDLEKLYGPGEKVPGDATVVEILFDRVILQRGGVLETLLLTGQEKEIPSGSLRPAGGIKPKGDGVNWQIGRDYWNGRLADIPSLAREVGVEIYRENNIQKGYRLVSARGSKLLRDLGLEPGDVLHEVNGVPLNSVHDGLAVYQKMAEATEVRITISRNGKRESRVYRIGN